MLHNQANLHRVLDQIAIRPKLGPAMRAIGASEKLIFSWMRRSAAGDPALIVRDYPAGAGGEMQFVKAVALARRMWTVNFEHTLRSEIAPVDEGGRQTASNFGRPARQAGFNLIGATQPRIGFIDQ